MKLDEFSYQCGVIDCFNEMVKSGLKRIALGHPQKSGKERDAYLGFSEEICKKYGTRFYCEDEPLLTDLFPLSLNRGTFGLVFYRREEDLAAYLALKERKRTLMQKNAYRGDARYQLARDFGLLLGYPEEAAARLVLENRQREEEAVSE